MILLTADTIRSPSLPRKRPLERKQETNETPTKFVRSETLSCGCLKVLKTADQKKMMGHFDVKHLHGSKSPFVLPYSEDDQYQNETSW